MTVWLPSGIKSREQARKADKQSPPEADI